MLKRIVKRIVKDTVLALGLFALIFIVIESAPITQQLCTEHRLEVYEETIDFGKNIIPLALLGSLIEFTILEFELFSKNKWIRRSIVTSTLIVMALIVFYKDGMLSYCPNNILIPAIIAFVVFTAVGSFIGYYIQDKKQKRDIACINEKLKEINPNDM